jgi:hypothetical protein
VPRMEALLQDRRLYELLERFDEDLADTARTGGCPCGGRLHQASYPRKPRGGPDDLGDSYGRRHSFCCAEEGCRRRATPPSVRFLGRKVYLGAVIVLATAMQHGPTPTRAARLRELIGASQRTLRRWFRWWQEAFCETAFWKAALGVFASPVEEMQLPLSLLERFRAPGRTWRSVVALALSFLGPLTTTGSSAERGK